MENKNKKLADLAMKTALMFLVFFVLTSAIVLASSTPQFSQSISAGSKSVDVVDSNGDTVGSPSVAFSGASFSFSTQQSTGTLGTSSQKIRVANPTATATWTASIAGSGTTAVWTDGGSNTYDFNDSNGSGYTDGADADSVGGQLAVDPTGGTIAGVSGCSTSNVTVGSSSAFVEGTTNSITLMSAASGAATSCRWDLTGVALTQKIPASQGVANYTISMALTVS